MFVLRNHFCRTGRLARRLIVVGLLMWGIGATNVCAQSGMRSVQAVSTGGGTSAHSGGVSGLYANPAHLTVGDPDHAIEMQLFRVSGYSGGDLFQFDHYRTLFTRREAEGSRLSDEEETAVLDEWFGRSTRSAATYLELIPLAMTYRSPDGRWGVGGGLRGRVVQKTGLNRGFFDLLLQGTGTNRTVPINGYTRLYSTVDLTGAFSYRFSAIPLSVGIAPRLILGMGYADGVLESEVEVRDAALIHRFDYTARAAGTLSTGLYDTFDAFSVSPIRTVFGETNGLAGVGGGIDVGMSYAVRSDLHVSMSLTDLGLVWWTEGAQTVTPTNNSFQFDGFELDVHRLNEEFGGDAGAYVEHQIDSLARSAYQDVGRDRAPFRTGQPAAMHVNSTWDSGPVSVNGGVSVGLNEAAGAVPRPLAVYAGGETSLGVVPVRAGVRLWGSQAVTLAGGIGLHVGRYRMDVGASVTPTTSMLGKGARYAVSVSLGTIRF